MPIEAAQGDITLETVDAIVNAANASLRRGGGVCGAIFAAAGPELDRACAAIGSCETGAAVVTLYPSVGGTPAIKDYFALFDVDTDAIVAAMKGKKLSLIHI